MRALVFEQKDHGISLTDIDNDARKICMRLQNNGYEAYIVGGAVRDLLLGKHPKDFDIATNAVPSLVRQMFSNSRVIGRRFRLVHIYFHNNVIHEVATFRASQSGNGKDLYGTIWEDVMRRDFSINALYYNPEDETILDFVGGVKDIQERVINSVLSLENSFIDDPVRMLRAVKYAALSDMRLAPVVGRRIKKQANLLTTASISRLGEELNKIFKSRNTEKIFRLMDKYGLLAPFFPNIDEILVKNGSKLKKQFLNNLSKIDNLDIDEEPKNYGGLVLRHMTEPLLDSSGMLKGQYVFEDVIQHLKNLLLPIIQPNRCIEAAVRLMFTDRNLKVPPKKYRRTKGGPTSRFYKNRQRRTDDKLRAKV